MKESILDVLLYLFEHYFAEDAAPPLPLGDDAALRDGPLVTELTGLGETKSCVRSRVPVTTNSSTDTAPVGSVS